MALPATAGGYFAYETFGGMLSLFRLAARTLWLYFLFRPNLDMFTGLGGGLRSSQNFSRNLDALTANPRDSDAHYQLGLIYQQRCNDTEAISRFTKAVEIDPSETDAHHQLGVIALEQKRYEDARRHFAATLALNDKHSSSEAWRGRARPTCNWEDTEQALAELQKYTDRREFDPEGLFWLGDAFKKLGRIPEARNAFQRAVEAASNGSAASQAIYLGVGPPGESRTTRFRKKGLHDHNNLRLRVRSGSSASSFHSSDYRTLDVRIIGSTSIFSGRFIQRDKPVWVHNRIELSAH